MVWLWSVPQKAHVLNACSPDTMGRYRKLRTGSEGSVPSGDAPLKPTDRLGSHPLFFGLWGTSRVVCSTVMCLPQAQSNGVNWWGTETSAMVSQQANRFSHSVGLLRHFLTVWENFLLYPQSRLKRMAGDKHEKSQVTALYAHLSLTLDSTKSKHLLPFRENLVSDSSKVSLSGIMTITTMKGQTFMSQQCQRNLK